MLMPIHWFQKKFSELNKEELYSILKFRMEVLMLNQKNIYLDLDNVDQQSTHFFGIEKGQLKVYARTHIDSANESAYIRPIAIHRPLENKEKNDLLIKKIIHFIDSFSKVNKIYIRVHHQLHDFYLKHGFVPFDQPYDYGHVLHIDMIRTQQANSG
jgi:ElaA protein